MTMMIQTRWQKNDAFCTAACFVMIINLRLFRFRFDSVVHSYSLIQLTTYQLKRQQLNWTCLKFDAKNSINIFQEHKSSNFSDLTFDIALKNPVQRQSSTHNWETVADFISVRIRIQIISNEMISEDRLIECKPMRVK